ncbi:MAG: cytochrome ubiquinol oxidase subunit I [Micavibrio aeruginosavorus]|uniref:Cytochrome ubiquinol oxidase subunit I n=1 Tax=Micavibrio aeruginosavorus TaxID=349221 RepID=A0A2W5C006_9BACT|nr:MAG: cytochrome ubiquinol oxidase subunit I [Micavibrio aeruginosavorus]
MDMDPAILARIQFAANITFHILFPSITIALGWILLFFKHRFNVTQDHKWMEAYFFWTKIFALCFAMGVVSGITMSFQFGTNWPGFMNTVGNIAGPLLAYEVLTAFFLEATFLGIMLFGFSRVPRWLHNLATFLVAFGTTVSAFWILVLNSWMQTPAGFEMRDGVAYATDWFEIIFNPSFPYRLTHMLIASGLTASFLVAGISAYRWLRHDRGPAVMSALKTGVTIAAILIPAQMFVGDMHGLNTLKHQPQKVAAMEGLWETTKGAPLVLFGMPNLETKQNDYVLEIPKFASLILMHDLNGEIKGLNEFAPDHPPVAPVFWAFRIMVGTGLLMLAVSWAAAFFIYRRKDLVKPVAYILVPMAFSGWVATVSGWYVTEIGRQPWLVTGVLRTVDAISDVPAPFIGISLSMYLTIYAVLMAAFITTLFYMARKAGEKPKEKPPINSGKAVVEAITD